MSKQPQSEPLTRFIWLLGHPVAHSLSPRLHNAAFRHQGLHIRYLAVDVPPEELSQAVFRMRHLEILGANVTIPHKETVIPLLDSTDPQAARVGAVNTVVNNNGHLVGHNTDILGFQAALRTLMPTGAHGSSCLVIGAGGAAKAVVASLLLDGPDEIWVANRTLERAVKLCTSIGQGAEGICAPIGLNQVRDVARHVEIVVNATSLGLPVSVKEFPLAVDTLHSGQVLIDVVYGFAPTPLVSAARARGVLAIDGKEMLLQQAARSYELWTGGEAPVKVMRESIAAIEG